MGSSFPRHGARVRTKTQEKEQKKKKKKTKGKLHVSIKIYIYRNNNLYDARIDKCHDACSNAVITSAI